MTHKVYLEFEVEDVSTAHRLAASLYDQVYSLEATSNPDVFVAEVGPVSDDAVGEPEPGYKDEYTDPRRPETVISDIISEALLRALRFTESRR